jgi:hypothetical protein
MPVLALEGVDCLGESQTKTPVRRLTEVHSEGVTGMTTITRED